MVSYLLAVKVSILLLSLVHWTNGVLQNANPRSIGYVTSGFWAGASLGRFIWGYLSAM